MDKQETFNKLFDAGMSYTDYLGRSERYQERMDKAVKATDSKLDEMADIISSIDVPLRVLTIAENWCGDCANGVPVISQLATRCKEWNYRIVPREDFDDEVEAFYTTAGRKKIPVVIWADEDGEEVTRWIERPANSYQILADLQAKRLPKEEYIKEYKSTPELKPPKVVDYILDELLYHAQKTAAMVKILPSKR